MNTIYSESKTQQHIKSLQEGLQLTFPGTILIPSREGGKIPKYAHKDGKYTYNMFLDRGYKECNEGCLIILTKDVIVIDIDDQDTCKTIENTFDELTKTVCCETKKGRHYYFTSTEYSHKHGLKDGARQMKTEDNESLPIDIKTVGGVISIPPSPNKKWLNPILDTAMLPMPDTFVDFYVANLSKTRNKLEEKTKQIDETTTQCDDNSPKDKQSMIPRDNTTTIDIDDVKILMGMLNTTRSDNYTEWLQLGWCLHNVGNTSSEFFTLWDDFSKISPKYKIGECEKLWNDMRDEGLNIGSLRMWAREDNPKKYATFINNSVFMLIKDCNGSHCSIARIAHKLCSCKHVCVSLNGKLWYYFNGSQWEEDAEAINLRREISKGLRDQFMMVLNKIRCQEADTQSSASSMSSSNKEICERLLRISFKLEDVGFKDSLVRQMREQFYDKHFFGRLDANPNLISFGNGVWDLKKGVFRKSTSEDMISLSVGYNYNPVIDYEARDNIEKYFIQLHPNNDQRSYIIKMLSRQLYGDSGNELFHIHAGFKGSAGNGKSKFFEVLELALGDYVRKFAVEMLVLKQRVDPTKPVPEYKYWKGCRILYCSEPNVDDKLNSGVMKELTGGEVVKYRLLYANDVHTFRPMYKMHIMCNETPQVDGSDQGVKRRLRKLDYIAKFVDIEDVDEANHMYLKDMGFTEMFKFNPSYKMEFLRYILHHFDHNYGYEMPYIIKENSREYIEDNDNVLKFVQEFIVKDKDEYFTLKQAKELFRKSDHYNNKITNLKNELQKILKTSCDDQKKIQGVKYNFVFSGWKIQEYEECDL